VQFFGLIYALYVVLSAPAKKVGAVGLLGALEKKLTPDLLADSATSSLQPS
jgi:hypothetical protein